MNAKTQPTGTGWELHIIRQAVQIRKNRTRTLGTYVVMHDGTPTSLAGTSVESKGPGDNRVRGNGRRVEEGTYPLATQDGLNYKTIGYIVTDDPDQTPKPGLELLHTGNRTEILIHPGHDFIASVGCINLTGALSSANTDIRFVDSRKRVIAVINDLKAYLGELFPHYNGQPIANASAVITGEP